MDGMKKKITYVGQLMTYKNFEKKIIYVDVDGCICTTSYDDKDFEDNYSSYLYVVPHLDRIERINGLFEEGHHIVYWTARGCKSGIDMTDMTRINCKSGVQNILIYR